MGFRISGIEPRLSQIVPARVLLAHKRQLPVTTPVLDLFLTCDRRGDIIRLLKPDKTVDVVFRCETRSVRKPVLPH
ncbi:MAG: hypothetical protein V3T49_06765, partial [Dehalococcoidia bacterium]